MNLTALHPAAVTAAEFESSVLAASRERLVLVDFWAAWCGPCKALAPILEQVAAAEADRLTVVTVDADAETEPTARHGVRALPSLLLFRDGAEVDRLVGLHSVAAIRARIAAAGAPGR